MLWIFEECVYFLILQTAVVKLFAEIQRLDGENDGYISRNEFKLLLLRLNICFSARKINDAFAQFDLNANGKIDIKEFNNFIFEKEHFAVRFRAIYMY